MNITSRFATAVPANVVFVEGVTVALQKEDGSWVAYITKGGDTRGPIALVHPQDQFPTFIMPPRIEDLEAFLFLPIFPVGHGQIQVTLRWDNHGNSVLVMGTVWRETVAEGDDPRHYIPLDWVTPLQEDSPNAAFYRRWQRTSQA